MTQSTAATTILDEITQTISNLPKGKILCSGEAFKIAQRIADKAVSNEMPDLPETEKKRAVLAILHEAYPTAREIIATQFIGMTFEQIVDIIKQARERFQGTRELAITPKPTLAYTGECEPLDPWNLISNAIHADLAAKEAQAKGDWNDADEELANEIERTQQMLHFICQREVNVGDITGKPFNGTITRHTRVIPLS
ncbi:hypothetical protein [Rhizobium sp. MHM7A]|uniref:hypothetical protein n=1 Tax=Rhizobium sp. MHM7A TaxID=2583233 RepID=UPI001106541E|nr:hypothetical protein [Rhizobium sp. MHM7A]TLX16131.1 hypothetical protein FFR93_02060 [Rhizobium sp. MHM7A]